MAINAGTVQAKAALDMSPFKGSLRDLRKRGSKAAGDITKGFVKESDQISKALGDIDFPDMPGAREITMQLDRISYQSEKAARSITGLATRVDSDLGGASLAGLDAQIEGIDESLAEAIPTADRLADQIKGVNSAASRGAGGLRSLRSASGNTTTAVMNLNRVIQDAPFGLMGVANNIDPLVQSFGQLRKSADSTTGALKQLILGAFTGPGALITVVSVATAGLLAFGNRLSGIGPMARKAESDLKSFDEVLKSVAETEVGDMFSGMTNKQKLSALKDAMEAFDPAEESITNIEADWDQITKNAAQTAKNTAQLGNNMAEVQSNVDKIAGTSEVLTEEQLNQIKQAHKINDLVNEELQKRYAQARATKLIREQIEKTRKESASTASNISQVSVELQKVKDKIFGVEQGFQNINDIIGSDLEGKQFDLSKKLFPPGSLGDLQNQLGTLREQLRFATDPETIQQLQQQIGLTKEEINQLTGQAVTSAQTLAGFADTMGNMFSQAVLHGEKLEDVLNNIIKQFASKAFVNAMAMLLSGGSFSIGKLLFGSAGSIINANDALITSGGDVVKFHPKDNILAMKDFGNLRPQGGGGGSISESAMERAFGKALDRRLQKLSNDEIYAMAQKGRRGY